MRLAQPIAATAALAAAVAFAAEAPEAPIKRWDGKPTPALVLPALSGETVDLEKLKGTVVVVNFWATWCEPCRAEMPSLQRLQARMHDKALRVLTVNYGEFPPRIKPFLEREKIDLPVLLDTQKDVAREWGAGGLPISYLVDAQGKVRYWVFGERAWDEGEPLKLVESLVAEARDAGR
ncbi:MAG TPA: TlpA disulfide reductase family protein [Usitatibacter sp.]|nr:TlpA disulfide reductase family protein [Usitatibacter sp.]